MREFKLNSEYIELIKLLKIIGIAETGGHAKLLVDDQQVLVNGQTELRKRAKLRTWQLQRRDNKRMVWSESLKFLLDCKLVREDGVCVCV